MAKRFETGNKSQVIANAARIASMSESELLQDYEKLLQDAIDYDHGEVEIETNRTVVAKLKAAIRDYDRLAAEVKKSHLRS